MLVYFYRMQILRFGSQTNSSWHIPQRPGSRRALSLTPPPPASSRLRAASSAPHPPRCTLRPRAKKSVRRVRAREKSAPAECRPDQRGPASERGTPGAQAVEASPSPEPRPSARRRRGPQPAARVLPPAAGDTAPLGPTPAAASWLILFKPSI